MLQTTEIIRPTESGRKRASELDDGPQWYADVCQRMRKAGKVSTEVVVLSPSRAAALLAHNEQNRALSDAKIAAFAADILGGRWQFNGETIKIAKDGKLNDGQHRCQAVITAGRAIEVLLVTGLHREARFTVDMGAPRTVGHFLGMHGITDANHVASIALIMHAFDTDTVLTSKKGAIHVQRREHRSTKTEIRAYAEENLVEIQRAMKAFDKKAAARIGTFSRVCGIAAVIARRSGDWKSVEEFFNYVLHGEGISSKHPAFVLRNRLLDEKRKNSSSPGEFFEMVIRGWNAYRGGTKLSIVKVLNVIPDIVR